MVSACVSFVDLNAAHGFLYVGRTRCLAIEQLLCAAATVGVVTETNAEKAIEELKAYEARPSTCSQM
jgi:hypothetical protein